MAHATVACTYDKSMLSTHCDDRPVDDRQQRHHYVLDVLKCFSLRKQIQWAGKRMTDKDKEGKKRQRWVKVC